MQGNSPPELRPQLRHVEVFPIQHEGEVLLCLRDPEGLAEQPIFLNGQLTLIVSLMDGSRTLPEIQAEFLRRSGEALDHDQLVEVVEQLDRFRYFDSSTFYKFQSEQIEIFRAAESRPATHAGGAYAGDPIELRKQMAAFFEPPEGPGPIRRAQQETPLRGLIAPHIDFHRGGPAYGYAYKELAGHAPADCYIIFGTCHAAMKQRFALTTKHYQTPLGPAVTDQEFVRRLAEKLPRDYFLDEFSHRNEHSIEFQAVCLRYLFGDETVFRIVPILVGSFHEILEEKKSVADDAEIDTMVKAIRQTISDLPGRYCMIAGADLAHLGRRFGDSSGPTVASLERVETEDRRFLELVAAGDAEAAVQTIAADGDRRRVCGYPPIYMALRCIDDPRGRLLHYRQWADFDNGAAVTFASLALF